jgi:uncharacterized protein (TIGR00730 family)
MRSLCVFCSSRRGSSAEFAAAAERMGSEIARRALRLVYGGGDSGLMGTLAQAALSGGGSVTGIIPREIAGHVGQLKGAELKVVSSMHARKMEMFRSSDGFAALPGGIGTLEEMSEMYTWLQLGFSTKPVGLLNTSGFFDPLLDFFDSMVSSGLLKPVHRSMLVTADEPGQLIDLLENFSYTYHQKW